MYSEEYEKRWAELRGWKFSALIDKCCALHVYGTGGGRHGLAGWSHHELEKAILRSEFPAEASNG